MKRLLIIVFFVMSFLNTYSQKTFTYEINKFKESNSLDENVYFIQGLIEMTYENEIFTHFNLQCENLSAECFSLSLNLIPQNISEGSHIYTSKEGYSVEIIFGDFEKIILYIYSSKGSYYIFNLTTSLKRI